MDAGPTGVLDAAVQEDCKMVIPIVPLVLEVAGDPQRGVKRTRRERGSTAKERISKMPPCAAGKRSSIYRGVTRHRWTGRYEAHLWDKSTWNQSQNKKGKQVYLGAYDEEEAAARAYDLAALKYWGPGTLINFPLSDYARDVEEMQNVTREEYLASLRRKSSGFSRGVSKYRGVARHHHNGRWEARIGRVFGNKYLYLGTYSTQEEAASAYDMAAIEYRGLNAVTNFDLSRYIRWLRPGQNNGVLQETDATISPKLEPGGDDSQVTGSMDENHSQEEYPKQQGSVTNAYRLPSLALGPSSTQQRSPSSPSALGLLEQSSLFKQMVDRAMAAAASTESDSISPEPSEGQQQHHPTQQQQHLQQQLDNNPFYPASWGKPASHQLQQQQALSLSANEGSVYHSHDDSTSYRFSGTSNYQGVVERHYTELQDHKQQHKQQQHYEVQQHQHQDHLTAAYGHGGYSHSPVPALFSEPNSGASATLEDGSWAFSNVVLPMSSVISSC